VHDCKADNGLLASGHGFYCHDAQMMSKGFWWVTRYLLTIFGRENSLGQQDAKSIGGYHPTCRTPMLHDQYQGNFSLCAALPMDIADKAKAM
jgi:hypothetical protein